MLGLWQGWRAGACRLELAPPCPAPPPPSRPGQTGQAPHSPGTLTSYGYASVIPHLKGHYIVQVPYWHTSMERSSRVGCGSGCCMRFYHSPPPELTARIHTTSTSPAPTLPVVCVPWLSFQGLLGSEPSSHRYPVRCQKEGDKSTQGSPGKVFYRKHHLSFKRTEIYFPNRERQGLGT